MRNVISSFSLPLQSPWEITVRPLVGSLKLRDQSAATSLWGVDLYCLLTGIVYYPSTSTPSRRSWFRTRGDDILFLKYYYNLQNVVPVTSHP